MQRRFKYLLMIFVLAGFGGLNAARALNICAVCGKEIEGSIYEMTDRVTGQRVLVDSNCLTTLPRCFICGLPIKKGDELELPDGRFFCKRDGADLVIKTEDVQQTCANVKNDLDRMFSRFTSFPNNVDVMAIDMIDTEYLFTRETPGLLGLTKPVMDDNGNHHYEIRLVTGLPLSELKETCAHEYSHTWVGENVPVERHRRIARDAEEGFCEMVGYLYVDSLGDEQQKKRVLANTYTRGQVTLFVQAEQQYGFDDILDWMRYGVTSKLEAGHLDEIRDVKMPAPGTAVGASIQNANVFVPVNHPAVVIPAAPTTIKLEGIMWEKPPSAIISGRTFFVDDVNRVKLGVTNVTIRCVAIQKDSVRIQDVNSGKEQELDLPKN